MEHVSQCQDEGSSSSSESTDFISLSLERVNEFLQLTQLGKREIEKCRGKPVSLIMGDTGVGKSAFFNYLQGVEMRIATAEEVGLNRDLFEDGVVDVVQNDHADLHSHFNVSQIGHNESSQTQFPKVALIHDMAFCDCPGFLENRGDEISLAHAVHIHEICHLAQSVRIILLVDYMSISDSRSVNLDKVVKMMEKLFGSSSILERYSGSIILGVTKVPRIQPNESLVCLTVLTNRLKKMKQPILEILADTLFIFDPVDDGQVPKMKLYPVMSKELLLMKVSQCPAIVDPLTTFHMALSSKDELILRKICEHLVEALNTLIKSGAWVEAAHVFQNFKKLTVLQHAVVSTSMRAVHKNFTNIQYEVERSVKETLKNGGTKSAQERLDYLARLSKTFEDPECEELLKQLVEEYKKVKFWKIVKTSAAVTAGVVVCSVAIGTGAFLIPVGAAAAAGISVGVGFCGFGTVVGVSQKKVNDVKAFHPLENAQPFHTET